jgi:hypothetical protein
MALTRLVVVGPLCSRETTSLVYLDAQVRIFFQAFFRNQTIAPGAPAMSFGWFVVTICTKGTGEGCAPAATSRQPCRYPRKVRTGFVRDFREPGMSNFGGLGVAPTQISLVYVLSQAWDLYNRRGRVFKGFFLFQSDCSVCRKCRLRTLWPCVRWPPAVSACPIMVRRN